MRLIAENRYHAPLAEKSEGELFYAIENSHLDASQCRAELRGRGLSDEYIALRVELGYQGMLKHYGLKA